MTHNTKNPAIVAAQVVDNLSPGGAELVVVNLANDMANMPGITQHIICTRDDGDAKHFINSNVQLHYLHQRGRFSLGSFLRFRKVVKQHGINIVHAHSTSFLYPALWKMLMRFKLVWHDHYGKPVGPKGERNYPYIMFSRTFDYVFCVNRTKEAENKRFLKTNPENIHYLPNYSVFRNDATENVTLTRGETGKRLVILANVRPAKDYLNLLAALDIVRRQLPGVFVYALGDHSNINYVAQVKERIVQLGLEDHIALTGPVRNPELYLRQANGGILCSEYEGMPLSLLEYGMASLPVICTSVGHCPEMLAHGERGWLVPPHDAESLANAIIYLLTNPAEAKAKAALYHEFVMLAYSKESIINKVADVYRELTAR